MYDLERIADGGPTQRGTIRPEIVVATTEESVVVINCNGAKPRWYKMECNYAV